MSEVTEIAGADRADGMGRIGGGGGAQGILARDAAKRILDFLDLR